MPNYLYRCDLCGDEKIFNLSIMTNPRECILCEHCALCSMERRICPPSHVAMKKSTLGAWFKKKTGRELLGPEPSE